MTIRNGLALILVAVFGLISPAFAVEFSFPGLSCVQDGQDGFQGLVYGNGSARNLSSTLNADVRCPLQQYSTTEDEINLAVVVNDLHSSEEVVCFIRTCDANGTSCVSSSTTSSGTSFEGTKQMSLNGTSINADGLMFLQCNLPEFQGSYSSVVSYRWKDI